MSVVAGDLEQTHPGPLQAAWTTFYPDLVTLVLILFGVMTLPDVLTAYAAESAAMGAITLWFTGGWRLIFSRAALAFVLMPLAFGAIALPHVEWRWSNLLGILAVILTTTIAEVRLQRTAQRDRRNVILTLIWRFVIIVFGVIVDLEWVGQIKQLDAAGWDGAATGVPILPMGAWFDHWVVASGVDPMLVATLVFFAFKTGNETLVAAYRVLRDRWRADAGSEATATRKR